MVEAAQDIYIPYILRQIILDITEDMFCLLGKFNFWGKKWVRRAKLILSSW